MCMCYVLTLGTYTRAQLTSPVHCVCARALIKLNLMPECCAELGVCVLDDVLCLIF